MPFGRESARDYVKRFSGGSPSLRVTNAFRQGVHAGQRIFPSGRRAIQRESPMPFGRESTRDPEKSFLEKLFS